MGLDLILLGYASVAYRFQNRNIIPHKFTRPSLVKAEEHGHKQYHNYEFHFFFKIWFDSLRPSQQIFSNVG